MLTDVQKSDIDKMCPVAQSVSLGTEVQEVQTYAVYGITAAITADASVTPVTTTVPFACKIIDVVVLATATNASGTVTVSDGSDNAISDAIAMATNDAKALASTLDGTYTSLASGATLKFTSNGADDRGEITVLVLKA